MSINVLIVCGAGAPYPTTVSVMGKLMLAGMFPGKTQPRYYLIGWQAPDCQIDLLKGRWRRACPTMPKEFDVVVFEHCDRMSSKTTKSVIRNSTFKQAHQLLRAGGLLMYDNPRFSMYPLDRPVYQYNPGVPHRETPTPPDHTHLGFGFVGTIKSGPDSNGVSEEYAVYSKGKGNAPLNTVIDTRQAERRRAAQAKHAIARRIARQIRDTNTGYVNARGRTVWAGADSVTTYVRTPTGYKIPPARPVRRRTS